MTQVLDSVKDTGQFYIADLKLPKDGKKPIDVLPGKGDVEIERCYHALGGISFRVGNLKWEKFGIRSLNPQMSLCHILFIICVTLWFEAIEEV